MAVQPLCASRETDPPALSGRVLSMFLVSAAPSDATPRSRTAASPDVLAIMWPLPRVRVVDDAGGAEVPDLDCFSAPDVVRGLDDERQLALLVVHRDGIA